MSEGELPKKIRVLNGHVLYFAGTQGNYTFLTWERPRAQGFRKWLERWLAADLVDNVLTVYVTDPGRFGLDGETPSREEMLAMIPLIRQLRFAKVKSRDGTPATQIFISNPNVDADLVKQFREAFPHLCINSGQH